MSEPRIVLYTKGDCPLCDEAARMLDRIGEPYRPAFDEQYATRVPVIEVDGRIVTEGRVGERAVLRALKASRAR